MAPKQPLASMTGFARQDGGDGQLTWTWEVKSVNGRGLDLRCRVPPGYEALEAAARVATPKVCTRGNLQLNLNVNRPQQTANLQINREFLNQLIRTVQELGAEIEAPPPRLEGLLSVRGVVEPVEEEDKAEVRAAREAALRSDLDAVLGALSENRRIEGKRLAELIEGHLASISELVAQASDCAAVQPEAMRERLRNQIQELLEAQPALPEERLTQEAAILLTKADVREELDRLRAHIEAARDLLAEGGPIGRRLDFLCQEFNREANTLCSKSPDVALTRIGLELKGAIDQLREQVQNLE